MKLSRQHQRHDGKYQRRVGSAAPAQRCLVAILAADVVGYSRLMEQDEAGTLVALAERRKAILESLFAKYRGRAIRLMGDGTLAEFASAVDAVHRSALFETRS